uniref:NB-ARC domain-containing protein n=1 Tax=Oryza punctata TaxID=4537 RepID=A0A0E0KN22_ORYPU
MAEILVSASTGAMNSLLKKLAAMLGTEYKLQKDVREDIEFMKDELEAMRAFLLKMSVVEDPDVQAKLRIRAVRELSYDIEDQIDKSMVLMDHEPASRTHGFKEFIDKSKNLLTKLKTQRQIAKEIKAIKKQVIEVSERFARYRVDQGTPKLQNSSIDPRVCAIYKDASDLVGIDEPVKDIIKCLIDEDELAKDLKVISIVGFGGLGKTTLANQMYRKLAAKFECRAFVSISRNPDMRSILKSLLSQICNQEYVQTDTWDENQIITTIRKLLEKTRFFIQPFDRYLIIVDDIWSIPTWEIMECAFPKKDCKSRIITTTRKIDVAHCCTSHGDLVYQIKPLSKIDYKRLFLRRIFGSDECCPSNLEEASNAILKKCGGLPLAIITTSSLLANNHTTNQWDRVQRSIGYALAENSDIEGMNKILSLSYFELPHHLRTCLLYVTIFPEDHEIPRSQRIYVVVAEHDVVESMTPSMIFLYQSLLKRTLLLQPIIHGLLVCYHQIQRSVGYPCEENIIKNILVTL